MEPKQDLPILAFAASRDWEDWLAEHHASSKGLWLQLAKKNAASPSVTYAEALDAALCYGWIDGQKAAYDERYWLQKFTPRGRRSKWSRVNRDKAMALLAGGRMEAAGRAQIEQARQDGRWEAAYESQSRAMVPDDLQRALDAHPAAQAFFATLDSANRYAILYRLHDAKRPETRARRLDQYISMLEASKKLHP